MTTTSVATNWASMTNDERDRAGSEHIDAQLALRGLVRDRKPGARLVTVCALLTGVPVKVGAR